MKPLVDIIIPTFNNPGYLNPCLKSILSTGFLNTGMGRIIIVNNGSQRIKDFIGDVSDGILILEPGKNLGWEGGLEFALKESEAPFVCFQNDDTFIPFVADREFYTKLLMPFQDDNVGIVAPVTTCAAGVQSIYNQSTPPAWIYAKWVIFFTAMIRRKHLDEVGGIDATLPGGDDLDLSIRMKKAGKKIVINPECFLIHHGFKTGERVKGSPEVDGGWNSIGMTEKTNRALIQKHGFKTFLNTITSQVEGFAQFNTGHDSEGDFIRSTVRDDEKIVVDLACGFQKTMERAIGVDRVPKGEFIPLFINKPTPSVADVVADITKPLPFEDSSVDVVIARHIIEHCVDAISALKNWVSILKPEGRLIVATPNDKLCNGIPLSADHAHSFSPEAMDSMLELLNFKRTAFWSENGLSFVSVYERTEVPVLLSPSFDVNNGETIVCSE